MGKGASFTLLLLQQRDRDRRPKKVIYNSCMCEMQHFYQINELMTDEREVARALSNFSRTR